MSEPQRLATLETMTEAELHLIGTLKTLAAFTTRDRADLVAEISAQRLARARERREAFRAGFLAVVDKLHESGWSFDGPAAADREQEAWKAWLKALRDREEA